MRVFPQFIGALPKQIKMYEFVYIDFKFNDVYDGFFLFNY